MNHAGPLLIGIAGGSGSGKTWLSRRIAMTFPGQVAHVSLDEFYRDRSHLPPGARRRINYDHPRAIDWPLLLQFLKSYRDGTRPILPRYDFTTHSRGQFVPCELKPVLVIEGLWTLARRELREIFDATIYLDCPPRLRLARRIARDTTEQECAGSASAVSPKRRAHAHRPRCAAEASGNNSADTPDFRSAS
jgi:uridine kinase